MKLIVAFCRNKGIGWKNIIPWSLKKDMIKFKKRTIGGGNNAVIMGKNTWKSIPSKFKPLPKRANIVLTRNPYSMHQPMYQMPPVVASSLEEAVDFCKRYNYDEIFIIGGAKVYQESLDKKYIDTIYTTYIDANFTCDTFFPPIPPQFILEKQSPWQYSNELKYRFQTYILPQNCFQGFQ